MPDDQLFHMRVMFCKRGRAAMLSHLEVARALERMVRRAGLPYAISQGFSPHMKISFGSALPVGVGGLHECFDIVLTRYVKPEEAAADMRDACVPDLLVASCDYIAANEPAASAAFPYSTYEAYFKNIPETYSVPEEVRVMRKKKERVLHVADFLVDGPKMEGHTMTFTLESKPTGSLRPDVLLSAMMIDDPDAKVLTITRVAQSI